MTSPNGKLKPWSTGIACLGFCAASLWTTSASAAVHKGTPVRVGKGTAQVIVHTANDGNPTRITVSMSRGAVEGVPKELNKKSAEGSWDYHLPMPKGVKTGYSEVVIDWNPHGHPPPHIYTVPHFDFHFYAITRKEISAIRYTGPKDPAIAVSDKGLIAADYRVIPDTAVNMMGVHAIDTTAPELHGKPFTATFIYGYDKGRLIFIEPMVTQAFLMTKPNETMLVKRPARYSIAASWPDKYSVRYDAASKRYMIELSGLKSWH